jgi:hypothetical protein
MRLPKPFYRLPIRFDVERLRAEVAALPATAWVSHPNDYAGNTSLRLISVDGAENDSLRGPMRPTPHLLASQYLQQVLASFGVVWSRSRLMRLAPRATVPEHADASYHWCSRVRIHIPILTRVGVRFRCGDAEVHMAAGEAWVFDNWRRHSVDNGSDEERIHLVADTSGTAAFWQFVLASDTSAPENDRFIAYQPQVHVRLATEQSAPRPVMPPAEVELLLNDFISELTVVDGVPEAPQNLSRYVGLLNGFCLDWRQVYLLHGENVAATGAYEKMLDGLREATKPISQGLIMATNSSPAQAVLESRLLMHVFRPEELPTVRARPGPLPSVQRNLPARPVFIVSAPRSGSTLLFESMAVSPQVCTLGGEAHWLVEQFPELRPGAPGVDSNRLGGERVNADVAAQIGRSLWERMVDCERAAVSIDDLVTRNLRWFEKTPKNSLRIPFLNRLFPDALFVYLWRDPRGNVSSIMDAWRAGGWVTYPALDGWDGPWSMILPPGWQALRGQPLEEIAAYQWERTNNIILDDLQVRPRERWAVVEYDEFVRDPASVLRGVCDFAGLEFDAALAARASAPLPESRSTLTPPEQEKWLHNEAAVNRVLPRLQAMWQKLRLLPTLTPRSDSRNAG